MVTSGFIRTNTLARSNTHTHTICLTIILLIILLSDRTKVYPAVVAAHPSDPNQFALGLTNGGVVVMEPPESEGMWGTMPPVENAGPNASSAVVRINSQGDSDS